MKIIKCGGWVLNVLGWGGGAWDMGVQICSKTVHPLSLAYLLHSVRSATLRYAPLRGAPLRINALHSAVLRYAPLCSATLRSAALRCVPLHCAPLRSVSLRSAPLRITLLRSESFCNAPFRSDSIRSTLIILIARLITHSLAHSHVEMYHHMNDSFFLGFFCALSINWSLNPFFRRC